MRRRITEVLACSALCSLLPGGALLAAPASSDDGHRQEFSIQGVYVIADDDRTDEYGSGVRATYGFQLDKQLWLEPHLFANVIETGDEVGVDAYQQGLGADVSYRFLTDSDLDPFVFAGGGLSRNDVDGNSASEFGGFANVGVGVLSPAFTDSGLRVRADARYLYDTYDDGFQDIHLSLGITIPIGAVRERVVEKTVVVEKTRVKELADSDGDGVVDGVDQCPNTLSGLDVNAVGCVDSGQTQTVVLKGVTFEFNSDRLTANARDILQRAAGALKGQPDLRVELAGHTDNVGAAAYNQSLSQNRAEAVRDYLIDQGVQADQVTAKGYGESRPLMSNDTEEGRERNRRVEFNVISGTQQSDREM